jgi:hypothetical protein
MDNPTVSRTDFNRAVDLLGLNHEDRGLHLTSVSIERGTIHAEYASVTKLRDGASVAPKYHTSTEMPPGLYRIYWRATDPKYPPYSLAAVGMDAKGRAWLAPTNWITVPTFDWSSVDRAERIEFQ